MHTNFIVLLVGVQESGTVQQPPTPFFRALWPPPNGTFGGRASKKSPRFLAGGGKSPLDFMVREGGERPLDF